MRGGGATRNFSESFAHGAIFTGSATMARKSLIGLLN
jgi:hypothetical protein